MCFDQIQLNSFHFVNVTEKKQIKKIISTTFKNEVKKIIEIEQKMIFEADQEKPKLARGSEVLE